MTKKNLSQICCRNEPGMTREEWSSWNNLPFEQIESSLNVSLWIQQCVKSDPKNIVKILECPATVEERVWKYEHLRQFCMELNGMAVLLQEECTPKTCPKMTATEQWIFLCAAHKNPKECSAIDYTRHTLDSAAAFLNSSRYFGSRVNIKESSIARIGSICRRIYRIFSHAYYHHHNMYNSFEHETYLCKRFTTFVVQNQLVQDHLIVPIDDQK